MSRFFQKEQSHVSRGTANLLVAEIQIADQEEVEGQLLVSVSLFNLTESAPSSLSSSATNVCKRHRCTVCCYDTEILLLDDDV